MKRALLTIVIGFLAAAGDGAVAHAVCAGDCSADGKVTVNELVLGVNIALERAPVDQCAAMDVDGNQQVKVDELISAVRVALAGCNQGLRLIALSRDGHIASLDIAAPWTVRASSDLGATIASARCRAGRCVVTHPSPADAISIVDAADLSRVGPVGLERGADPRDVAFVDDETVVISQYGSADLIQFDLTRRTRGLIHLAVLADADGVPEALRLASCGRRVFVQLQRVDHDTGVPAAIGAVLAVIDLDLPLSDRIVDADPTTPGVQGIALAGRPNFDMPIDCDAGTLYVAEPMPVLQGGSRYEQVDLETFMVSELPLDGSAEAGGFEVVEPGLYWVITHTDFGPGASSHLNLMGGSSSDTYNTFASEHVNDLALDRDEDLLFFPDPCTRGPANQSCETGIHVFDAHSGAPASVEAIDVGFAPIEVVVSR